MNNQRRKEIQEIMDGIGILREQIESLKDEEEEYRDNMPENLQGSDRYEKADEACSAMESAMDDLDNALSNLEEATN